ncbi:MAG: hypothetical protein HY427_02750 [Candidatus Levybacteria bacterium]|nr:hypothetical protein [Candidatus Levybacteria bacterium]
MAKARLTRNNRKLIILIVLFIAFAAGFLVARTRYKPQIRETFNMVQERESRISELKEVIKSYENQLTQPNRK